MAHDQTVLVLQGGGALGAYQAGVYEGMVECRDGAGLDLGRVDRRHQRCADRGQPGRAKARAPARILEPGVVRAAVESARAARAAARGAEPLQRLGVATFGVPGFFSPRIPPALFAPDATPGALSVYDTSPLRRTLDELVDFDFLNREQRIRLSVGSVNVHTGNSVYFDNRSRKLGVEHLMASGSLPPGFPPVMIEGEHYWDGGIVSNSPLWHVLDDSPSLNAFIVQVDLFSARGELPANLDQVLEREKDIQYSSKTRSNTTRVEQMENLRQALTRLMEKLPPELHDDPDYKLLQAGSRPQARDHHRPSHQPALRPFRELERLRILPHHGAPALAGRPRRRAARPRPPRLAQGDGSRERRSGIRSVALTHLTKDPL